MKQSYSKLILAMAVCIMMVYSSCRKSENAPAPVKSTTDNTALAGAQVAVNLSKSLAGNFGGVNLNDGVDTISFGPRHLYAANSLCGLFTDSLVNYDSKLADTAQLHTGGSLKFYFACTNGKPSGYVACDSLTTVETRSKAVDNFTIIQDYTIKCLDDKHLFVGVNGTNAYRNISTYTNSTVVTAKSKYVLNNLTVDICNKDILSGSATFTASGSTNNVTWSLAGTITFLGKHKADVVINNKTYHVNLITGVWS